jgi:hypothetical protein
MTWKLPVLPVGLPMDAIWDSRLMSTLPKQPVQKNNCRWILTLEAPNY